ncbi:MAG: hypothetical protein JSW06_08470 [Thermoplasmatales archaeon]|nr:MAG: hypothetical protein JSW06_08470 [Thermoplasmatales archaeon]
MSVIEIHQRPVIPDRLRLVVTPHYMSTKDVVELKSFFKFGFNTGQARGYRIRRYWLLNGKDMVNVDLPDYLFPEYCRHVSISLKHPYTVSLEFNFIRFLKDYILHIDKDGRKFRYDYEMNVLLDEDNIISYESWPYWNQNTIYFLMNCIRSKALRIGKIASFHIVPEVEIDYVNVSVKQAEFNVDYFVGSNFSSKVIDIFPSFFFSQDGREWRKGCGEIALKHYAPKGNNDLDISSKCGEAGHSFGFKIAKGLYLKVYRKTRDHIRTEILMDKKFIYYKFKGSRDISRVLKPMLEFSKDLFKEICFENTLYELLSDRQHVDTISQLYPLYDFIVKWKPALLDLFDSVLYGNTVVERDAIGLIKGDSALRGLFARTLSDTGRRVYKYNPIKAKE